MRAAPHDADPATFLLGLLNAVRRLDPGLGSDCLKRVQQLQWLEQRWPDLYAGLAEEINRADLRPTTIVLENADVLLVNRLTQISFYFHFLPGLPKKFRVVLSAENKPSARWLPTTTEYIAMHHLALDLEDCQKLFQTAGLSMDQKTLSRLLWLTGGRHALVSQICSFGKFFGRAYLEQNISKSRSQEDLLFRLSRDAALALPAEDLQAVVLLAYLGYNHPSLQKAVTGLKKSLDFPPVQRLANGWQLLSDAWMAALRRVRVVRSIDLHPGLVRAGAYLCGHNALLTGLELLMTLDAHDQAASLLDRNLHQLLHLGQWQNLSALITRLPRGTLKEFPRLPGAQGIILAGRGESQAAARLLFQSYRSALEKEAIGQACECLLALASMAEDENEFNRAVQYLGRAHKLAQAAGLDEQQGWAEYYLGGMLVKEKRYPEAETYYQHAHQLADRVGDIRLQVYLKAVSPLASRQVDLHNESLLRQQALQEAVQVEREQASELKQALSSADTARPLHETGAQGVPFTLLLRLAARAGKGGLQEVSGWRNAWRGIIGRVRRFLMDKWITRIDQPFEKIQEELATISPPTTQVLPVKESPTSMPTVDLLDKAAQTAVNQPGYPPLPAHSQPAAGIPVTGESTQRQTVAIYFLGNFRLGVDDVLLEGVPGGQVGVLLKYLLYHRRRRIPREELIELFWPDNDPELARNSLNVAISHVRQVFRDRITGDVVVFQDGKYMLNPGLEYWVDLDEFEKNLESARRYSQAGEDKAAIACLEVAANLYQGDFLADDPYEEWTLFPRERLHLAYLDALHQLSRHYFELKRYAACAAICQSILERDNCREDVHCLLMRCYARQEQFHLSLRQYQVCVDALNRELDIGPAEGTQALYRRLKRREHTRPGVT